MQAASDFFTKIFGLIGGVGENDWFSAGVADLRGQRDAVAVANLEGAGRGVYRDDFVAGGEDGDARFFCATEFGGAELRCEA